MASVRAPRTRRGRSASVGLRAVLAGLALLLLPLSAARADPGGPDGRTTVVVTRLSVTGGQGWLTAQPRFGRGQILGFGVSVPAGGGTWRGSADVPVPELGIHCRAQPGADLLYLCGAAPDGTWSGPFLPRGSYSVTLPVTRTGPLTALGGLVGSAWTVALDGYGEPSRFENDTFPVLDGTHYRSTAEVRSAPLTRDSPSSGSQGRATVSASVTIVPGEAIHALDATLPGGSWVLLGSNAVSLGMTCSVQPDLASRLLHCVAIGSTAGGAVPVFAAGRHQLVAVLHYADPDVPYESSIVSLTPAGGAPEAVDWFHFADGSIY